MSGAGRPAIVAPLVAVSLVIAIAWLTVDLLPLIRCEARLRRAAFLISESPIRGLDLIAKGSPADVVTKRQQARGGELAERGVRKLLEGTKLLRTVGVHPFDPGARVRSYATASRDIMLTFELPPGLRDLGAKVRVSEGGRELCDVRFSEDGVQGRGEVPLPLGGYVIADVDLVVPAGDFGVVVAPIAAALQMSQQSRGPVVKIRSGSRVDELKDEPLRLQVVRGTPLKIELSDELGLTELQWSIGGVAHDPFDWTEDADAPTREASLPASLTAEAAYPRLLEFKAANAIGITTRGVVELFVREPGTAPIASIRLDGDDLGDGSTVLVSKRSMALTAVVSKGELPEDLCVFWGDQPLKTRINGQEVTALLEGEAEGPRSLSLVVRGDPAVRSTVRFDWTAPVISASIDPGSFPRDLDVNKGLHDVPVGSVLKFTISDLGGLDPKLTEWTIDPELEEVPDLEPTSRPGEPIRSWGRLFRCTRPAEMKIRVGGWDLAGNRSTLHEYRIRGADPMEGRRLTINGKPFGPGSIAPSRETRFVIRSEGGIDVDGLVFSLRDPARLKDPLGQVVLERAEPAGARAGVVDVSFLAESGKRLLGLLSRNGSELLRGEVVIDFERPVFKVEKLVEAGAGPDETLRYYPPDGELVSLTLSDDVGVDVSTISVFRGAHIEDLDTVATPTRVVVRLPPVIEEPVVLRASDLAGNRAELRFEIVPRPGQPESAPASRRPAQSQPEAPAAERPPSLAELAGMPRVSHASLGTFLLVPVRDPGIAPFYAGEHEVTVKEWRAFVEWAQASSRDERGDKQQTIAAEASRLLAKNAKVWSKEDEDSVAGLTPELVRAYVGWANTVARDLGTWKVPTAAQWKLAAGRATQPHAVYPTTMDSQSGADLTNEGNRGAFFGHDYLAAQEMPKRAYGPGLYGLRAMAGGLYEWVVDSQVGYRMIGGSMVSSKEACRLEAPLRSSYEVADHERGLRLILMPARR